MLDSYLKSNNFDECIDYAIYNLKLENLDKAIDYIHEAMIQNDSSAKTHNLLGIVAEKQGNLELACRHYRASYYLDQTFEASSNNLERITSYSYVYKSEKIDYGEEIKIFNDKAYDIVYDIVYDERKIGRLQKIKNL